MNLIPAINQMESDISRYKNIRNEKYRDLRSAFWTFSKYSKSCDCHKGNPDDILNHLFDENPAICPNCNNIGYLPIENEINVIPAMQTILDTIKDNQKKYERQVKEIEAGLKVIREMNTTCERCKGTGQVQKPRPNVYCEREYINCPDCKGRGEIVK